MDLNDYWQENKRFVATVAGGVAVFLVGFFVLDSVYGQKIASTERRIAGFRSDLAQDLFSSADRTVAAQENEELRGAVATLSERLAFAPREGFRLDPALGSSASQYQRALTAVREDLFQRANRANLALEAELGMPKFSPTREEEIERYLEALDVIDSAVRLGISAGVRRMEDIRVRLDPGLSSNVGLGRVESTRVELVVVGSSLAVTRFLVSTQRAEGRALSVSELEMSQARNKDDEVRLDLTLVVPRLRPPALGAEEG